MPGEPGVRRAPAGQAPPGYRLTSPLRWERAVLAMLWAGLTADQISRLADLRVRLRRGACAGDGETGPPGTLATRRLEFARWLVRTGRLRFPLLSDFEAKGAVSRRYGAYRHDAGESARALFVIDPRGIIRRSYLSPVGVNPGADGILTALEALQKEERTA